MGEGELQPDPLLGELAEALVGDQLLLDLSDVAGAHEVVGNLARVSVAELAEGAVPLGLTESTQAQPGFWKAAYCFESVPRCIGPRLSSSRLIRSICRSMPRRSTLIRAYWQQAELAP